MQAWVMTVSNLGCSGRDVGARIFKEISPVETFNISFESTQNKQHYVTKITGTEVRKKLQ